MNTCSPAAAVYGKHVASIAGNCGGGALPFTGMNLALVIIGGVFMIALGWSMRRMTKGV